MGITLAIQMYMSLLRSYIFLLFIVFPLFGNGAELCSQIFQNDFHVWVERYENGDKENLVQFITNVRKSIGVDTNYTADGRFLFVDLEEPMKYYGPDRGELFVVRGEHGEILGSIGYSKIEPGVCELKKVYLDSSLRGRGLAEKLLTEMINRATQSGFKKMILQTNSRMTNAIGLYLKLGFEKMPDKEALNSTAIYYYLNLTEN